MSHVPHELEELQETSVAGAETTVRRMGRRLCYEESLC